MLLYRMDKTILMSSGPDILPVIPQQTQSCCNGPSSLHVSAAGAKWQAAHPLAGEVAASHLPGDDILLGVIIPHARIANLQGMCKHAQHAYNIHCMLLLRIMVHEESFMFVPAR